MKWPEFPERPFRVMTPDEMRLQQGELVESMVTAAEQGKHVHGHAGSSPDLFWCNQDPHCPDARPISELLF